MGKTRPDRLPVRTSFCGYGPTTRRCPRSLTRIPWGSALAEATRAFRTCPDTLAKNVFFLWSRQTTEALASCGALWAVGVAEKGVRGVLRFWMLTRCRDCCEGLMLTRLGEKAGAAPALSCAVAAGVPPQPAQPRTSTWGPCAESPLTKQWLPGAPGRPSSGEVSS